MPTPKYIRVNGTVYRRAETKSFYDYLLDGEVLFWKDVAARIRKAAGGHAEQVTVKRGRSVVWLEYEGQDRSDIDLSLHLSVVYGHDWPDVVLHLDGKSASRGKIEKDLRMTGGQLTSDVVLSLFLEYFG